VSGGSTVATSTIATDAHKGAPSPATVTQVACGDFHSCALASDGTVSCWGRNKSGELGDGTDTDRSVPTRVLGVSNVAEIALGANFSCARGKDGAVNCWGSGRLFGDGKLVSRVPPTRVPNLGNVVELRAGGYVTCARDASNTAKCWGLDAGLGKGPTSVRSLAVAAAHACAVVEGGTVQCWGEGAWSTTASPTYAKPTIGDVAQVATGDSFACVITTTGAVSCWGRNDESGLGTQADDDNHVAPAPVPNVSNVTSISASESHSCALTSAGKLLCWGSNSEGELARGTQSTGESAGEVPSLSDVTQVAMGADHGCAITKGGVFCWGANRSGQIGDGTTERRLSPVKVLFR
jgi:alpha-tubulin suppressor-like RCC1 family protein